MSAVSKTKRYFLAWLTAIYLIATIAVYALLHNWFPHYLIQHYVFVPLFFYIVGWYYIFCFEICRRYKSHRMMSLYMGMKVVKILLSILLVVFYVTVFKVDKTGFFIIFFIFYFLSIIYETWFFYMYEYNKQVKRKKA